MRPCWSVDPLDMLVTATAPLCNQGIHSHFYPASASFFLTERLPGSPAAGLLPWHPSPGGHGGRGAVGAEVRRQVESGAPLHTPWGLPLPPPFWDSISGQQEG